MNAASTYSYRARDQHGQAVTGTLSAESPEMVASQLRTDGLVLTGLRDASITAQVQADALVVQARQRARRVRRGDVVSMCQELGVMLERLGLSKDVHTQDALSRVFAAADVDGNGQVDFLEFTALFARAASSSAAPAAKAEEASAGSSCALA